MQAVSSLEQGKAEADRVAGEWRASCEAAQHRLDSEEASRVELEGQLQGKCREVEELRLSSTQQREVSPRTHNLTILLL